MILAVFAAACGGAPAAATPTPTALPPVVDAAGTTAEGNVEPLQYANLSFAIGGEVAEVSVKEGDTVKAGDVIAHLQSDAQQAAIAQAEAGVAAAKANEAKYQEQLPQQIAAAQADIQSAQAQIAAASARRSNQAEIAAAEAALTQAQVAEKQQQDAYDHLIETNQLGATEERARLALESAKRATEAARLRLNQVKTDRTGSADLAAANARLTAAQANLDQLQAEASGKPNPTYAAAIRQATAALQSAQARLADTELRAPFAGTIAQLNVKAGETVAPDAPLVILADLSGLQIVTDDLTEIKVPAIQVGQSATIKADALPTVSLKGTVTSIGALYQEKSGDIVYPVKIKLIDTDPGLRWGMTVNVTFEK
jgi:multidrug efflux pump subunit AcrA (membrane-fusion protein)